MLLVGTILGGWPLRSWPRPRPATAASHRAGSRHRPRRVRRRRSGTIRSIRCAGAERLEPETVRSYANLVPGQTYTAETLDTALKDLYATELFADVSIIGADTGQSGHPGARESGHQPHRP